MPESLEQELPAYENRADAGNLDGRKEPFVPIDIVLIEDDDGDARAVIRALSKAKVANPVVRYYDGEEALERLRGGDPELPQHYIILLDLNLPRMTGHEFLKEIREDPRLSEAIIFVMTTSRDEEDIQMAWSRNVAGYVLKSNVGEDFVNLIRTLDNYWHIVEKPAMSHRPA